MRIYEKLALFIAIVFSVSAETVYEKCGDNLQCAEKEMISYVDKLEGGTVPLLGDLVTLEKNEEVIESGRGDEDFVSRCVRYLANHELKFKIPSETAKKFVEEARSSKLKKIILPILLLLKLKAAIVIPAVLSAIALVAFKGLGTGLVALAIAGATGLKSLLDTHANSKLTYEVVPQFGPHWSRSGIEPLGTIPAGYLV